MDEQVKEFFTVLQTNENLQTVLEKRLRYIWGRLSYEKKRICLDVEFNEESFSQLKPIILARFWSFVFELQGEAIASLICKLRVAYVLPHAERRQAFVKVIHDVVSKFDNFIIEMTRDDPRTFSHLYRSVQRIIKYCFRSQLYDGQWFSPEGLNKELRNQYIAEYEDIDNSLIPLPANPPQLKDFFSDIGDFKSLPFVKLLQYYQEQVEQRALGKVVSLRNFCHWINKFYILTPSIYPLSVPSYEEGEEEETGMDLLSVKDIDGESPLSQELDVESQAHCREVALSIFGAMNQEQALLYVLYQRDYTLIEMAKVLKLSSHQKADSRLKNLFKNILHPRMQADPEAAFDDEIRKGILKMLLDLCENEVRECLPKEE